MPGITGFITERPRAEAEPELARMVNALRHESFYRTGTWICEEFGLYVGWVAIEGSFCEHMPLFNEKRDVVLVFSGEEFPDPHLAQRLKERGHVLETGFASHLVHEYEEEGESFPSGLNGRFQGLVIDRRCGKATLFNDRYGMNRLYYHERQGTFYFAAEAKAILAVRPELRAIDAQGIGELVSCGCVLENRTVFQGIHVLPPASAWKLEKGPKAEKQAYFQAREWEEQSRLQPEAYYEEMRRVFSTTLPRYFESADRIGISLTGGLDTRMIMAWQKAAPGTLPCFSFGGAYRDCQDVVDWQSSSERMSAAAQRDPGRDGVPFAICSICRANCLFDRRVRRCEPVARSLRHAARAPHRSSSNDRELRRRSTSQSARL